MFDLPSVIRGCRQNNRDSQKQLFEWLKVYAVNICHRYATRFSSTEDLVSDGFMKVYKNIGQYNDAAYGYSEAAFKNWFKRVVINNSINYLKQHESLFAPIETVWENGTQAEADHVSALDVMNYKEIFSLVMQLPGSYKTVFCLFAIDGYSHEEIATALGISIGTSKSNLFKARQHLKKALLS